MLCQIKIKKYLEIQLELLTRVENVTLFSQKNLKENAAVEIERITESLSGVLNQTKYIDFLALPFLSFTTLYKNKIIEKKNDLCSSKSSKWREWATKKYSLRYVHVQK